MPTIKQWLCCLEELWGDEIEVIRCSSDEFIVRFRQTKINANEAFSLAERVN